VDHQPAQHFSQPYPPVPTPASTSWNGKTNGFSIAALTMALLGCVSLPALVLAIIGLRQSNRNGDRRGRFFAIAALAICGLWLAAIGVAVAVNLSKGPDRDATGSVRGERSISIGKLRAGDCLKDIISQRGDYVDVVPCTTGHTSEVIGRITLPQGAWPGEDKIKEAGEAGCAKLFEGYAGGKVAEARSTTMLPVTPEMSDWPGERGVLCIAYHLRTSTESLRR
jgi:hypothetical protein